MTDHPTEGTGGKLKLQSQEGTIFEVSRQVSFMSQLCKNMAEDLEEGDDPLIPLPNVEKEVLKKIIDYMEYHHEEPAAEIERPLKTRLEDIICEWDRGFLDEISTEDRVMLFKVILGANFMDIKDLLDLTCAKVASLIKGKTPEEIREMFGIENDFTPEEEQAIKEENKWCEDA